MKTDLKRQNFNITPDQEAEVSWLKDAIDAPSAKEVFLYAVRVLTILARETQQGRSVYLEDESGRKERLLIPELETGSKERWSYLVKRPHPWRSQLYVKGRRLLASTVWMDMITNEMSREEAAENWSLSVDAINEIVRYCEDNKVLLQMEADEERQRLNSAGVDLETSH